jgi:hypothetical protein
MTSSILQDLCLPSEINELNEETQVDIAATIEEGNCLQAEVDLASRCCCQLVFTAHKQVLHADRLNTKLSTVRRDITTSVQDAMIANHQTKHDSISQHTGGHSKFSFSPSRLSPANVSV